MSPASYAHSVASDRRTYSEQRKRDLTLVYLMISIDVSCNASTMTMRDPQQVCNKLKELYSVALKQL